MQGELLLERLFNQHIEKTPEKLAFGLITPNQPLRSCTYRELGDYVLNCARLLLKRGCQNKPVVLIYDSGYDFIISFLSCMLINSIPVPLHSSKNKKQSWDRFQEVIKVANPYAIITQPKLRNDLGHLLVNNNLEIINLTVDEVVSSDESIFPEFLQKDEDPAYLQFTSGSTHSPKGVIVTHSNIVHNMYLMQDFCKTSAESIFVTWLPYFHDLGLIGQLLHSLYFGASCYIMNPMSFVQNPLLWLQSISKYRGTICYAPNFAYELCANKYNPKLLAGLDLSTWKVGLNGAEQVHAGTVKKFAEIYKPYGFSSTTHSPAYGLAEATLVISGTPYGEEPKIIKIDKKYFERGIIEPAKDNSCLEYVSCGKIWGQQSVKIVDPNTLKPLPSDKVGEIWVKGGSVAKGYWHAERATKETFQAETIDKDGPYLRTGDLGFIIDEHLYIAGRTKDLIVINGENYYPHDIEYFVSQLSKDFQPAGCCAFSIKEGASEQIIIVQEIARDKIRSVDYQTLDTLIREKIFAYLQISLKEVVFIKPMHLPKTSSGKVQRKTCANLFQKGELNKVRVGYKPLPKDNLTKDLLVWLDNYFAQLSYNSQQQDARRTIHPRTLLEFGNMGLLGIEIAKPYGGLGLNQAKAIEIYKAASSYDLTLGLLLVLNNTLAVYPLINYGSEKLKTEYLPTISQGRGLAAFALTELTGGSNPSSMLSTAHKRGNKWIINGHKVWSGSASWASIITVFTKCYADNGTFLGFSAFVIPQNTKGLRHGEEAMTIGMKAMVQNELYMENIELDDSMMLGRVGEGLEIAKQAMTYTRAAILSMSVGGIELAIKSIVPFVLSRSIVTGPMIANNQVQGVLGDIIIKHVLLKNLLTYTTTSLENVSSQRSVLLAVAKLMGSEFLWQAVDSSIQLMGARGYIEDNPLAQLMRDARVLRIFEGPTDILLHFLGLSIIKESSLIEDMTETKWLDGVTYKKTLLTTLDNIDRQNAKAVCALGNCFAWWVLAIANLEKADKQMQLFLRKSFNEVFNQLLVDEEGYTQAEIVSKLEQYNCIGVDGELKPKVSTLNTDCKLSNQIGVELLVDIFQKKFPDQKMNPETKFALIGLDSILALELTEEINKQYSLELMPAVFWEFKTIADLGDHIVSIRTSARETPSSQLREKLKKKLIQ